MGQISSLEQAFHPQAAPAILEHPMNLEMQDLSEMMHDLRGCRRISTMRNVPESIAEAAQDIGFGFGYDEWNRPRGLAFKSTCDSMPSARVFHFNNLLGFQSRSSQAKSAFGFQGNPRARSVLTSWLAPTAL